MTDHALQSCQDGNKCIKQSMHSYQSVGMTHWAPESDLYNDDRGDDKLHSRIVLGLAPKMFSASKTSTEVAKASGGFIASSEPSMDERLSDRSFPMFKVCGDSTWRPQIDCNVEASSLGHSFRSRGVSQVPGETMKSLKNVGDDSLALTMSSQDNVTGSTQIVLFNHDKGKAPVSLSFADRLLKHSSSILEFNERVPDASLLHCPSSDNRRTPVFFEEQHQRVNKYFDSRFSPSQNSFPGATMSGNGEGKRVWRGYPEQGFAEDCATFPHSTSLIGMKKTMLKEEIMFRGTSPDSRFKSKMLSGLLSFPARFGLGQQTKLHLPGSCSESEGNDKVEVVKNLRVQIRNESSAETNTMDMDTFQERSYLSTSGVNFPSLDMDILAGQDEASESAGEEEEQRKDITYLPDINEELLPSAPAVASSTDNTGQTSSRTQSLDPEQIISGSEQPGNPVLDLVSNGTTYPRPDPGSRWLKRPRLSAPGSLAVGTKCSSLGETSHHEKVKLVEGSEGSSGPTSHDKGKLYDDKASFDLNVVHSSSLASSEKHRDALLSHSWIRRWSHNPQASAHQKKLPAEVTCEKETTKMESGGDVKDKQFPSIAAMALMGKVMNGFEPCEFQRKGSFLVWNAKDI